VSEAREGRLDDAAELVEVVAYLELFMHPECYADLADMGVDVTLYDELLATLGYDHTVASYVEEGRGWIHANSAVIMVNDDELLENSIRWSEAELGSDEELVAVNEFLIRLVHVTLLHETVSSGSRPRDGHPTTGGDNCVLGFKPEFETLMVSGDQLALVLARFCDANDNEVVSLQVLGTDGRGLRTCCVSFEADDLDDATREFDRLGRAPH